MTDAAMVHWYELNREQQTDVICEMSVKGFTEDQIAAATKLAVEAVREILRSKAAA